MKLFNNCTLLLFPCCFLFIISCEDSRSSKEVTAVELTSDRGTFSYNIRGDLEVSKMGRADFYRAGTHVVIIFDSRTAPKRLELAYEETRSYHTGVFPTVQERDPGGFLMFYKNDDENYWQSEGTVEISVSNEDTIIGRMDQVILSHKVEGFTDSVEQIELTGHFEAY